jgi:hypothetical protein
LPLLNSAMKNQTKRASAARAMSPETPEANWLLSHFGKAASVPNGDAWRKWLLTIRTS